MVKLYTVSKNKTVAQIMSFLITKVGKTTRPFKYDLNQIPYNYKVEVISRFKGLDLMACLKNYGQRSLASYNPRGPKKSKTTE